MADHNQNMNNLNPQYAYPQQYPTQNMGNHQYPPQNMGADQSGMQPQYQPQQQQQFDQQQPQQQQQQQNINYGAPNQPQMMGAPQMAPQSNQPGALNLGMGYGQVNAVGNPQSPVGMPVNNYGQQNPDYGNPYIQGQPVSQPPQQPMGAYSPPGYAQGQPIEYQVIRAQVGVGIILPSPLSNLNHCDQPTAFRCTYCQKESISTMTTEPGTGTYTMCCLLCLCSMVLGCIPFCLPECQDKKHFCPFCGAQVGQKEYRPC